MNVVVGIILVVVVVALFLVQGITQIASWQQAVIQRGSDERLVKGPAWVLYLKGLETIRVLDCGERSFSPRIERCMTLDGKRGVIELTVVYRTVNARMAPPAEKVESLLTSFAEGALRRLALEHTIAELRTTSLVRDTLLVALPPVAAARGCEVTDVVLRRVGQVSDEEAYLSQIGNGARGLGAEGLYLRYLETLNDLAKSPAAKFVVPADLAKNPEAVIAALERADKPST
jgi:hypothetical protein